LQPLQIPPWPRHLRVAFDLFAPSALYVASANRPISIAVLSPEQGGEHVKIDGRVGDDGWIGGNPARWTQIGTTEDRPGYNGSKGCYAIKLGRSTYHHDRVTWSLPRDPYGAVKWALRWRIWCRGSEPCTDDCPPDCTVHRNDALWLESAVRAKVEEDSREARIDLLPYPYLDLGGYFTPDRFEEHYILPAARRLGIWVRSEQGLERFLSSAIDKAKLLYPGAARAHFRAVCEGMIQQEREKGRGLARPEAPSRREVEEDRRLVAEYLRERVRE
jgi:hypothetical protein